MADLGTRRLTYDDYCRLPDDGRRYELLGGELCMAPSPSTEHQAVSIRIASLLLSHVRRMGRGHAFAAPIDVVLSPRDVVQPDVLFVSEERSSIIEEKRIAGPPDIVVEILSDATRRRDRTAKRDLYARSGVREYWIVDLGARAIERLTLEGTALRPAGEARAGESFTSDILPGLSIAVDEIFP